MPNKKISQLVNKTTILSTDLFPIGDATSGQLYKKTIAELQAAIGGAVISVNGLVGTVVLDTDDIQELATPTNKYFTDARARAALSATSPLAFNSSTGVFSMPAATTSANGYLTSTDWNTFNGKENVLTFSSPLVRTSNTISMPAATTSVNGYLSSTDWNTFNNKQGALTLTVSGSSGASTLIGNTLNVPTYTLAGLGGITASFLSGGTGITYNSGTGVIATTITQYTDALARASLSFTAGSGAYNSTTGVITIPTNTNQLTNGASFITLGSLSAGTGITYNSTTGVISYSGTVYTDASIRGLFSGSTGISYNSTTGAISSTITQYTDALARAAISGGTGISYNSTTGVITNTITQYTDALARSSISGGTGISYNSTTGVITNTITQYTDALARASLSFTAGSGGYNSTTGVITIPTNNNQITNGAGYITSASLSGYLPLTGGTLTGALNGTSASFSDNVGIGVSVAANIGNLQIGGSANTSLFSQQGTDTVRIGVRSSGRTGISLDSSNTTYGSRMWYLDNVGANGSLTFGRSGLDVLTLANSGAATFSSNIDSNGSTVSINSSSYPKIRLNDTNTGGGIYYWQSIVGSFRLVDEVAGAARFLINSSGQSTFYNSVTATSFSVSNGSISSNGYWGTLLTTGTGSGFDFGIVKADTTAVAGIPTGTSYFYVANRLGIATSSPAYTLDVNGTGRFSGQLNAKNAIFDLGATTAIEINSVTNFNSSINYLVNGTSYFTAQILGDSTNLGDYRVYSFSAGEVFKLKYSTGAATFSSSVSAGGGALITGNINSTSGNYWEIKTDSNGYYILAINRADSNYNKPAYIDAKTLIINNGSSGNVLIGTTTDSGYKLNVNGSGNTVRIQGGTSGAPNLKIQSAIYPIIDFISDDTNSSNRNWRIASVYNQYGTFEITSSTTAGGTDYTSRLAIANTGNVLIGTLTDNGERLYVSGSIRATGTITANSDIRLKKNLERIENALEKVGQISGYTYNTIYDDKRHGGVIAQEIDEVFPEIVNKGNDGLLGVEYGNISALLIEALKELKEKNTALEARLQALEK